VKVLSIIPPLVQVNTPYPSTSFITGFLRELKYDASQADVGLELVLKLFSKEGLARIKKQIDLATKDPTLRFFLDAFSDYEKTIEPVIHFLQGKDPAIAHRISARALLPEGPRFQSVEQADLVFAFGTMGVHDQAKHIASLYIDDLVDVISLGVDPEFSLSRYGEKLAASQSSFDVMAKALARKPTLIDELLVEVLTPILEKVKPDVVLLTVPFPGCLYGALAVAKEVKRQKPKTKIALGGGYVNTELRSLKDARIFESVDAITLDDGERPLMLLLEYWQNKIARVALLRTYLLSEKLKQEIEYCNNENEHDIPQSNTGFPTVDGLPIGKYLSMVEMLNPMHRFWSDLYWNKLMLAHGCYWHQCSFCDVSLDYIKRYEMSPVELTVERMKRLSYESGSSGFHFVDEAAPPAVLKKLSEKLIDEKLSFSWWGNIRFEKTFTKELTELMGDAGCVAVSGGLEVASDRLLSKMKKGVTVEQVARVTKNFRNARVLVHAYLMYGFPTQTLQESIDSLERVRQLFKEGCLSSAFWHRFSATAHSPIGLNPDEFGIEVFRDEKLSFAENDLKFSDPSKVDHDRLGYGLKKAVYNFMLGIGLDDDVRNWFEFKVPKTTVDPQLIKKSLSLLSLLLIVCACSITKPCSEGGDVNWSPKIVGDKRCAQKTKPDGSVVNQGKFTQYYGSSADVALEGEFVDGLKEGIWLYYSEKHQLISLKYFDKGIECTPPIEAQKQMDLIIQQKAGAR
jgi:radical SAM superfamily enzyme YgiQ (UPF0313 family)